MGNVTKVLRGVEDRFPIGTSVSLYRRAQQSHDSAVPLGAAVATATVAADGTLTFAAVPDDGGGYVMVATVNAKPVLVRTGTGAISWATRH